jgi:hypothetical protein
VAKGVRSEFKPPCHKKKKKRKEKEDIPQEIISSFPELT